MRQHSKEHPKRKRKICEFGRERAVEKVRESKRESKRERKRARRRGVQ